MKRLVIILLLIGSFLMSCTTTYRVPTIYDLNRSLDSVSLKLNEEGYYLSGKNGNSQTNLEVIGYSSTNNNVNTLLGNKTTNLCTLSYIDTNGNTIEFSYSYNPHFTTNNWGDSFYYITSLNVNGCKVSDPKKYNCLCNNIIIPTIMNTPSPVEVDIYDKKKTTVSIIGLSVVSAIISLIVVISGPY